jgi:radical SAM superfamily enzyme YgiQ (UPF0313 family)
VTEKEPAHVKKKIYFIQPTYRDDKGRLFQGARLFTHSLTIPALSAAVPPNWEKQTCLEYFDDVDFESDAGVVGISCMGSDIFRGLEIAEEFKKRGKTVIFGGATAQLWKHVVASIADAVVFGNPGPLEMKEILDDAEKGRLQREYWLGMNVDFPFDYSVLAGRRISFMPMIAGVGCRGHCEFCCTATMYKGRHHLRPVDVVLTDMRTVRRMTRRIVFVDTNLYNDRGHLINLCERMIAEDFGFVWGAECPPSVGDDPETLRLLQRAGCRLLVIGIETISQSALKNMGKANLVQRYAEQIGRIREAGIRVGGFFMFGFDTDNVSVADELFNFIHGLRISLPTLNFLTPIPGTMLFDRLKAEGRLLVSDEADFLTRDLLFYGPRFRCYFKPAQMSPAEAEQAFLRLRKRLYSPLEIIRRSIVPDTLLAGVIFSGNLRCRAETKAIARALKGAG